MPTPIAQSEVDVERDRLVMEQSRMDEQGIFPMTDYGEDMTEQGILYFFKLRIVF